MIKYMTTPDTERLRKGCKFPECGEVSEKYPIYHLNVYDRYGDLYVDLGFGNIDFYGPIAEPKALDHAKRLVEGHLTASVHVLRDGVPFMRVAWVERGGSTEVEMSPLPEGAS